VHSADRSALTSSAETFGTNTIPRLISQGVQVSPEHCYNKLVAYVVCII